MEELENPQGLLGEVSEEQIASWKNQYGDIWAVEAGDGICYLKAPTRVVIGAASKFAQTDPLKFNETILNNCWLGGDESIKTDTGKFLAASSVLREMLEVPHASIKKL